MLKIIIKKLFVIYLKYKKHVHVSKTSEVSYNLLRNIGEGSQIADQTVITGEVGIGRYTTINSYGRIASRLNKIEIGSFCSVASNVTMQEYDHKYNKISTFFMNSKLFNLSVEQDIFSKGAIIIEDDVWIGANSVILSGVTIGRGSIVAAGSIVTKNVPRYSIVAGVPAKVIKTRFTQKTIEIIENLEWWEWNIEKIKQNVNLFNLTEEELLNININKSMQGK